MKALLAVALLVLSPAVHACINEVGTDYQGRRFDTSDYIGDDITVNMRERVARSYALKNAPQTTAAARKRPSFETLTNLGVLLIYQGQYPLAIRHFVAVERLYPGRHETAANLGTALELSGQDRIALRWIRLGIERNADEHYGTEWLHLRILEAKLAAARDPGYLQAHSVAGVRFQAKTVPALPSVMPPGNRGTPVSPAQLNRALQYQLYERGQFVSPPDPIVANLLSDWATLNLAGGPIENAEAIYKLAVAYGAPNDALLRERRAYIRTALARASGSPAEAATCPICGPG